ncbi:hypothetical protein LUZ60_008364 [Juncus effusus]|nr:hypothetical protein LUZ60_008364 [Juncus effusus]
MHRVGSAGNTNNSTRPRKEKRFTYVLNDADNTKHCGGINCLAYLKASDSNSCDYLFSGSRDGTIKRWELKDQNENPKFSATFESHVDWVNDVIIIGETLVSCSSDTTVKTWNCLSDGVCTKTLRQHSDYVTCLAGAEKNRNMVASGGLGGEVFIWDIESASSPLTKPPTSDPPSEEDPPPINGTLGTNPQSLRVVNSTNNLTMNSNINNDSSNKSQGGSGNGMYSPVCAKGHKDSVYALAMNESGSILVSGGTEKVVRVWDPRTGSKNMKLRGHTDNIRALLIDSTGRYCLSGSSDSMIRLWDLGQQRCVHSYAVHTDSVWALAATPSFSHVYSGGRDQSLYLTDLSTRESVLLCQLDHPILQLALQDETICVATTDSGLTGWPVEGPAPHKVFQKGGSFLAGNLSFSRARASLEGSAPVPVYKEPAFVIPGIPAIIQHEILNNRRHVLTKDTADSVKLWDITRGTVIRDYGKVSFEEKKEELFERVSIPSWFTMDTRLGCLSIHLDTPQCFSAEMYASEIKQNSAEDTKINLAQETLRGLLSHWLSNRKSPKPESLPAPSSKPDPLSPKSAEVAGSDSQGNSSDDLLFRFEGAASVMTEGKQGGLWRRRADELTGQEDERELPGWCLDCVLHGRFPRENTKCSFYLQPYEGSLVPPVTQGKLSAPRILRIFKVTNYVLEKFIIDKDLEPGPASNDSLFGLSTGHLQFPHLGGDNPTLKSGAKSGKPKHAIEVLCNNQVLDPQMSLGTVRTYVWKKPEDLVLQYRITQTR